MSTNSTFGNILFGCLRQVGCLIVIEVTANTGLTVDVQSVYDSPYRRWGASCRVCLPGPSVWSPTRGAWSPQTASSGASGPGSCPGPCGQGLTRPRRRRPDYPSIATWNSSRRSWLHVMYAGSRKVDRSWVYILATWKQLCMFVMN